jgi:hypothetical protein
MTWWLARGPLAIRAVGVLAMLWGGFIAYIVGARRPIES